MPAGGPPSNEMAARIEDAVARAYSGRRRLLLVAVVGFGVMAVEIAGALSSGSLALLADATHYFADLGAVLLALAATTLSTRAPSRAKTFGYQRAEVLAALFNAMVLWALIAYLLWEGYRRLSDPPPVVGRTVLVVGLFTFFADAGMALLLRKSSNTNINLRAAYLNLVSDAGGSLAVVASGVLVTLFGWHVADPILTGVITILIAIFAVRLTRETLHILMEGTPSRLDLGEIAKTLRAIPSVSDVHDLHVWTLSPGVESLSVHVVLDRPPNDDRILHEVQARLAERFRLEHTTVQVEDPSCLCETARHAIPSG